MNKERVITMANLTNFLGTAARATALEGNPMTKYNTPRTATINRGIATLENGVTVDLIRVQSRLINGFIATGDQSYADAANELGTITGLVQGAHGNWIHAQA
jgi:hypothetical protein